MLKGKKKALAAQVLLGLMVAGNAYAADFTIEGARNEAWKDENYGKLFGANEETKKIFGHNWA